MSLNVGRKGETANRQLHYTYDSIVDYVMYIKIYYIYLIYTVVHWHHYCLVINSTTDYGLIEFLNSHVKNDNFHPNG